MVLMLTGRRRSKLAPPMRAIAARAHAALFAAAEVNNAVFLGSVCLGRKLRTFMRTIAEGLLAALSAGTPIVGLARFDSDRIRRFLGNNGFAHGVSLSLNGAIAIKQSKGNPSVSLQITNGFGHYFAPSSGGKIGE